MTDRTTHVAVRMTAAQVAKLEQLAVAYGLPGGRSEVLRALVDGAQVKRVFTWELPAAGILGTHERGEQT